ncbi:MAG: hypothetical protein QOJ65_1109 [Fimbriimonadaceae bacterium]|jgi:hypothetical protein|nr:hypothetical protein [Fimbriimonadaceae bacterium]
MLKYICLPKPYQLTRSDRQIVAPTVDAGEVGSVTAVWQRLQAVGAGREAARHMAQNAQSPDAHRVTPFASPVGTLPPRHEA